MADETYILSGEFQVQSLYVPDPSGTPVDMTSVILTSTASLSFMNEKEKVDIKGDPNEKLFLQSNVGIEGEVSILLHEGMFDDGTVRMEFKDFINAFYDYPSKFKITLARVAGGASYLDLVVKIDPSLATIEESVYFTIEGIELKDNEIIEVKISFEASKAATSITNTV